MVSVGEHRGMADHVAQIHDRDQFFSSNIEIKNSAINFYLTHRGLLEFYHWEVFAMLSSHKWKIVK